MSSALLISDVQIDIVKNVTHGEALLERLGAAINAARAANIPVIYLAVGYRPGYPEISANNADAVRFKDAGRFQISEESTGVHPSIAPQPGDIQVPKKRVGSFTGGDLDLILRAGKIDTLVIGGISTSGSVLSTVRESADRDFAQVVLSDGCTDNDPEVHRVLTEKVFPRQAAVMTVDEWVAGLGDK